MSLDLSNPKDFAAWVLELRTAVKDVCSAAHDQIAPISKRRLGRAAAREIIHESCDKLDALLALANASTVAPPGEERA